MAKKEEEVVVEEVQDEVVEVSQPEEVEVKKAPRKAKAKKVSAFDAFWNGDAQTKQRKGMSPNHIINSAKVVYGEGFDQDKYRDYRASNVCVSLSEKVEAVWLSQ